MNKQYDYSCLDVVLPAAAVGEEYGDSIAEGAVIGLNAAAAAAVVKAPLPGEAKAAIGSAMAGLEAHATALAQEYGPEYVGALSAVTTFGLCEANSAIASWDTGYPGGAGGAWQQPSSEPLAQGAPTASQGSDYGGSNVDWSGVLGSSDVGAGFSPAPDAVASANAIGPVSSDSGSESGGSGTNHDSGGGSTGDSGSSGSGGS
ncbi:MAG: hypothetical protein ACK5TQ_09020 [Acetobacteraceae bacterium]|jgi:hypothetical protein